MPIKGPERYRMENVHFIAIGGSAMHNLALALKYKGLTVTGSDDKIFEPSRTRLDKEGLLPEAEGWFPEKIHAGLDGIVLGMHAKKDNPELLKAIELGLPIFSYPEFLYEQSKDKTRVVIGGSHGKTSTTSIILHVLNSLEQEVDYMVGAQLDGFDRMVKLTKEAKSIVLEGDEYLSSPLDLRSKFLLYKPHIAVLTGIAWDHVNVFPTFQSYLDTFRAFLDLIDPAGVLIYNEDDKQLVDLIAEKKRAYRLIPYTAHTSRIDNAQTILTNGSGEVPIQIFGDHNLMNLQAAFHVLTEMNISEKEMYGAIPSFSGASKRLEKLVDRPDLKVYKDFAHSPSKVEATLNAVCEQFKGWEVMVCFELHTYSSLSAGFMAEYRNTMQGMHKGLVFYNKEALRIKRLPDIAKEVVSEAFDNPELQIANRGEEVLEFVNTEFNPEAKQVWLMMSSGDFDGMIIKDMFPVVEVQ